MTGRVKVIKRTAVTTGQLRRLSGSVSREAVSLPQTADPERIEPEPIPAAPASVVLPPTPEPASSATVDVVNLSPEATELRVRCACGCETVIALNHPAEGGVS